MSRRQQTISLEKPRNTRETLKKLGLVLKGHIVGIIFIMLFGIITAVLQVAAPLILGQATDTIIGAYSIGLNMNRLLMIIVRLMAVYLASAILNYISQLILFSVTQNIIYGLRKDINQKLRKLPLSYFDSSSLGDILSRVTNDVDTMATSLQQTLPNVLSALLTLVFVFVSMLILSPKLTLIGLVTIPLSAIVSLLIIRGSQKYFRGQQVCVGRIGGYIEEMFTGHEVIRAFNQEDSTIRNFEEYNEKLYANAKRAQFVSGLLMPLSGFFTNIGYILVAVIGGIQVVLNPGALSIGNLQTFIQLLRQFTHPITQISNMANELQTTIAAAERVFEFLEETEEPADPINPAVIENPQGDVVLEHVKFGYTPDNILMHDLCMAFNSGDKVAILGPTGAGKTTLVNLLLRFYDIQAGKILIDGVDITQMRREDLRGLFGMVLQDTWLFSGTIMENIRYGRLGASDDEVIAAAKNAYVHDFIRTLPEGYDMMLDEDGSNISAGQRQLITIARAILSNPTILILDEATSSVDTRTEKMIQRAMENLMEGRTSFVIAHRLSTIRDSKTILVLNHGDIVEAGNHKELIAKNGFYTELYRKQLSGIAEDSTL